MALPILDQLAHLLDACIYVFLSLFLFCLYEPVRAVDFSVERLDAIIFKVCRQSLILSVFRIIAIKSLVLNFVEHSVIVFEVVEPGVCVFNLLNIELSI